LASANPGKTARQKSLELFLLHCSSWNMANIENVKGILNKGIRFGAGGRIHPKQIEEEAAQRLLSCGTVTMERLEQIGRNLTGDRLLFCEVNIEQLNKVLEKKQTSEVGK
jgi:hypothetical protein